MGTRPELVLLPGMDGTGMLFGPLLDELGDLNTTAISYPNDRIMGYDDTVSYVKKRLPNTRDFILLAESYSGPVALKLTQQGLANLRGIVFVASFHTNPRPFLLSIVQWLPWGLIFRLQIPDWIIHRYFLGPDVPDEKIALFRKAIRTVKPSVLAERLRNIANLKPDTGSVTVPCHYLEGSQDRLISQSCVADLIKATNATIHILSGPHFLALTNPQHIGKILRSILARFALLN